uniref:Reverse transcriptase zinc-binding domain-containing protein n=1 Tax=Physcomitrium patens TaxID=3218 RepID=A9REF0_PHYPA|nr:hypothetical protein PHYPA_021388 [Physcomitrium patens]
MWVGELPRPTVQIWGPYTCGPRQRFENLASIPNSNSWWLSTDLVCHLKLKGWTESHRLALGSKGTFVVSVVEVQRGQGKQRSLLYYGRTSNINWDPKRFSWGDTAPIMTYTASIGRNLLKTAHIVLEVVPAKWKGVLPTDYRLKWLNTWDKERTQKEAGLLWLIWHRAVAVDAWRGRTNSGVHQCCPACLCSKRETVLHRFWKCPSTERVWRWGTHILRSFIKDPHVAGHHRGPQVEVPTMIRRTPLEGVECHCWSSPAHGSTACLLIAYPGDSNQSVDCVSY